MAKMVKIKDINLSLWEDRNKQFQIWACRQVFKDGIYLVHCVSPTEDIKMGFSSQKGPDVYYTMQASKCIKIASQFHQKSKINFKKPMEIQCFLAT